MLSKYKMKTIKSVIIFFKSLSSIRVALGTWALGLPPFYWTKNLSAFPCINATEFEPYWMQDKCLIQSTN